MSGQGLLFRCPITQEVMENPVTLLGDGQTYEESALKDWLEDNDKSPLTGVTLRNKEYCVNRVVKDMIEEWRRSHASDRLVKHQEDRFQKIFKASSDQHQGAFDCTVLVGEDQIPFRCVRKVVGALSPFFRTLLLSPDAESESTFEIADVAPEGFEQIMRNAYHLDPKISADNVIETVTACHKCGVIPLKNACLAHLSTNISDAKVVEKVMVALQPDNDFGIDEELHDVLIGLLLNRPLDGDNAMTVFNSALSLKMLTPAMERRCCRVFSTQADQVIQSPSFLTCRVELMEALVGSDFFSVNEEKLWTRVCAWCVLQMENEATEKTENEEETKEAPGDPNAATEVVVPAVESVTTTTGGSDWTTNLDPSVGGVLGLGVMTEKQLRKFKQSQEGLNFPEAARKYLEPLVPLFRFTLMGLQFFTQKVAPLLPRDLAGNVLIHKLMSEVETKFNTNPRVSSGNQGPAFTVVAASHELDKAKLIPDPNSDAKWSGVKMNVSGNKQWFAIDCISEVTISKFDWKNFYEDNDTIKTVELHALAPGVEYSNEIAAEMTQWRHVQNFDIAQSTEVREHTVLNQVESRYFKWVVTEIYGGGDNYTCLNYLKLYVDRAGWSTNFANKLDDEE